MELSCPAPKHCEYGRKMASAAWEAHETPRLSAKFSSYDPFKTARLNQAGRKNKLRHSCGVTATLATKNHKALYSLLRDQKFACSQTPSKSCKLWWPGPAGPVPVARSRWPGPGGPVPLARSPGGPVRWPGPVARSRWPGPGGPVPVARSRWPGPGPALRACPRARAKKALFCLARVYHSYSPFRLLDFYKNGQSADQQKQRKAEAFSVPSPHNLNHPHMYP